MRKYETAVTSSVRDGGHGGFGRKFPQFSFNTQLSTCRCCNRSFFSETLVDILGEKSSKEPGKKFSLVMVYQQNCANHVER